MPEIDRAFLPTVLAIVDGENLMQLPTLYPATLLRRYKRFMADVELANQQTLTLHCANTGAMTGCGQAGDRVWYSDSQNPTRKYPCSWELTQLGGQQLVCINTQRANLLVLEALQQKRIKELADYEHCRAEVKYGAENSRIDFLLQSDGLPDCYVEVKSVTLVKGSRGMFPDAVTTRGQKHLRELMAVKAQGKRAVIFFAGLHSGFDHFRVAEHIDPVYAQLLADARVAGVEVYCYGCEFRWQDGVPISISLSRPVPVA